MGSPCLVLCILWGRLLSHLVSFWLATDFVHEGLHVFISGQ